MLAILSGSARIGQFGDGAAGDHPEVEACYAAAGREAAAILREKLLRDLAVAIDHPHPAMDSKVAVAQDIGSLQSEDRKSVV